MAGTASRNRIPNVFRMPVAIRDTRSVGLLSFRNSEFSKISDSHIPRPRKCPVKGPYADAKNGHMRYKQGASGGSRH